MANKAYITKYALTRGIFEEEGRFVSGNFIVSHEWSTKAIQLFKLGDFHTDLKEALKQAEIKRQRKIDSLKRQIEKLEKLEF